MPPNIGYIQNVGTVTDSQDLTGKDLGYDYPRDLDLRPGSELHEALKVRIISMVRESKDVMQRRYANWRDLDNKLTGYIEPDAEEKKIRGDDKRKAISIVIPMSYATLETILTYLTAALLRDPIVKYEGVGPEDTVGAILLEHNINYQLRKSKAILALHTMLRDSLVYGFGIVSPQWRVEKAYRRVVEETGFAGSILGAIFPREQKKVRKRVTSFEGNKIFNIDPYKALPDPSMPVNDLQRGDRLGWIDRTSYFSLLEDEINDSSMFNAKYVDFIDGRSRYNLGEESGRLDKTGGQREPGRVQNKVSDVIHMYAKIIPSKWGLGREDTPETWLFSLVGDQVIIKASPMNLDHEMFPAAVSSPDYDGYSTAPVGVIELGMGMQEFLDFSMNSHITNVRKMINDVLIVDPMLVNMNDMKDPGPGKLIRLRRSAWGRGLADKAVKQLEVVDITRNNVNDAFTMLDMSQRTTGAAEVLQGGRRRTSERVSATEARDTRMSALSRMEKAAMLTSTQAIVDIAHMCASHTQQLQTEDTYIKIMGEHVERLMREFGVEAGSKVAVKPEQLSVYYDVVPNDGTMPSNADSQVWMQIFQTVAGNEMLLQKFDIVRIFKHIARIEGAKNIEEFQLREVQANVMPDEQLEGQVQQGNLVPIEGIPGNGQ